MVDSGKIRLVRCPKCENLLPELPDYSVYQCGGCGAVLKAKHKHNESAILPEKSNEGRIGGNSARLEDLSDKGFVSNDTSEVDVKSNSESSSYSQRHSEKKSNGHEKFSDESREIDAKGAIENSIEAEKDRDEMHNAVEREQEDPNSQIGPRKGLRFSNRVSNWENGERIEMEGFWRKLRGDVEGVRFSTSNHPDEGTSSSYSSFSYGEQWRNPRDVDGTKKVQHPEQDRAELLRKLVELKDQLRQSCEVGNIPKEKVRVDGRTVPLDPYSSSDTWFPDGSSRLNNTSRQFFGSDKHVAGPSYFSYHHDPFAYTNGHEIGMHHNFHPSMHNPNHLPGYGDPFASQMLRRGPNQLPHQFPQQPLHPYFPGHYVDSNPDSYDQCAHNAMLHPSSCSCLNCFENKRRGSALVPPAAFFNSRFPDVTNDPMLYRHNVPGTFGPHVLNSRIAIPPHASWPSDLNSETDGFVRTRPRKVMLVNGSRRCRPIAGGSPFITCYNCSEILQLPKKTAVMVKNPWKVRCGGCSSEISFTVINKKLVLSPHLEVKAVESPDKVLNRCRSYSHGHARRNGADFSSDDYSGYDFHSVDREHVSLPVDTNSNSSKPQETQSSHSSSPSTSEDEHNPEAIVASREVTKSIPQLAKGASLSSPPAGSPLQEHFDYSNGNHNRFGKGNRSSRAEQEKVKIDKMTSRQNSLKEAAVATEMDIHDYPNAGVSQDSGDASREYEHPRSNKGGESFFANIIKKSFRDFSRSSQTNERGKINVIVNDSPIPARVLKKAEKLAGPIQPGNYWYDSRAGFWGVMGGPCLGIIPPFIEEFNHTMPDNCSSGNTGVFVNGRELHQKDLDLLVGRGLPTDKDRSYIIEISGRVLDEDTGEELDCLGKLAPTVQKVKHGFGMKAPRVAA